MDLLSKLLSRGYTEDIELVKDVLTKKEELRNKDDDQLMEQILRRKEYKFTEITNETFYETYKNYLIASVILIGITFLSYYYWDDILNIINKIYPDSGSSDPGSSTADSPASSTTPKSTNIVLDKDPLRNMPENMRKEYNLYFKDPSSSQGITHQQPADSPNVTPKARPLDLINDLPSWKDE
jgi:hypothetical protein